MPASDPVAQPQIERHGIRTLLLDIEGTTCPVRFVADTLFPYASQALEAFLSREEPQSEEVRQLLHSVRHAWQEDPHPYASRLLEEAGGDVAVYLRWLIEQDRKLPALKQLQGLIWEEGYRSGELVAPLFEEVPACLRRWNRQGVGLAVYSSGSVPAQRLLYQHTTVGDLRSLFQHWFDTRVGSKQESESYASIASAIGLDPAEVLYISDSTAECRAARAAGLDVLFSDRPDNPHRDPEGFVAIKSFTQLQLTC